MRRVYTVVECGGIVVRVVESELGRGWRLKRFELADAAPPEGFDWVKGKHGDPAPDDALWFDGELCRPYCDEMIQGEDLHAARAAAGQPTRGRIPRVVRRWR